MKIRTIIFYAVSLAGALLVCSCGGSREAYTVLIRMMDIQDQYFRNTLIPAAEKELGVKLHVATYDRVEDIERMIRNDADKQRLVLVKTALEQVTPMIEQKLVLPLDNIVSATALRADLAEYDAAAVRFGSHAGQTWFIPRKLECNLFLFIQSEVARAVKDWFGMRKGIEAMFERENGTGLPAGYTLEADPNQWDWYDLAVAAYVWAHTPGADSLTHGRLAHRAKDYGGTTVELLTKLYQAGGTADDFFTMQSDAVLDLFAWEAFMVKNGLYNAAMWEQRWSGGGIWKGFAAGQVYAAFMHQIDAFFIHGGTHPTMQGYLCNPDDMGLAVMPAGASLELNAQGQPVRCGVHASNFSGWWWGIPATTPNAELSYKLARFITGHEQHARECAIFGMMPVRRDMIDTLDRSFKQPWMREVFSASQAQFAACVVEPPRSAQFVRIGEIWRRAWYSLVVEAYAGAPDKPIDRTALDRSLQPFRKQIKELTATP